MNEVKWKNEYNNLHSILYYIKRIYIIYTGGFSSTKP